MNLSEKINQLAPQSPQALAYIEKHLTRFSFKKGEEVLRNGKICNYLFYISRGLMRGYYLLDEKEVTNWLACENDFGTSYYSFISHTASYESLECLEATDVQALSFDVVQQLYIRFPETERVGRLILEEYYLRLEERLISIQFKSARERYEQFLKTRPEIASRAPLGAIASYLGMTQETLSRIRI